MSTLFEPTHRIVCAYNKGFSGPTPYPDTPIPIYNAAARLCSHAVHMTRSLKHSMGSQIGGNVLFFYLEPKKDFLADPDFRAAQATINAWDDTDIDCSPKALRQLAKVFKNNLTSPAAHAAPRIDYLDVIVFPALESKPFITKHPFRYDDEEFLAIHIFEGDYALGHTLKDTRLVGHTPKRGNLPNQLLVFMRDGFLKDGSPRNKSVLVATGGAARHNWAGNIIVTKKRGTSEIGVDANEDDVEAAIEYFAAYGA